MQNLVFLRPAETMAGDTSLSEIGRGDLEQIIHNLQAEVPDLGSVSVWSSFERRAILTGESVIGCLPVGIYGGQRYELGNEVGGEPMKNTAVWAWLHVEAPKWQTIIIVTHRELLARFPAYWMQEVIKVDHPPRFDIDNSQGILIAAGKATTI